MLKQENFLRAAACPLFCALLLLIFHSCTTTVCSGLAANYYRKDIVNVVRKLCTPPEAYCRQWRTLTAFKGLWIKAYEDKIKPRACWAEVFYIKISFSYVCCNIMLVVDTGHDIMMYSNKIFMQLMMQVICGAQQYRIRISCCVCVFTHTSIFTNLMKSFWGSIGNFFLL